MATSQNLKDAFPWLGTDDDANGADTIDKLNDWYSRLLFYEEVMGSYAPTIDVEKPSKEERARNNQQIEQFLLNCLDEVRSR